MQRYPPTVQKSTPTSQCIVEYLIAATCLLIILCGNNDIGTGPITTPEILLPHTPPRTPPSMIHILECIVFRLQTAAFFSFASFHNVVARTVVIFHRCDLLPIPSAHVNKFHFSIGKPATQFHSHQNVSFVPAHISELICAFGCTKLGNTTRNASIIFSIAESRSTGGPSKDRTTS